MGVKWIWSCTNLYIRPGSYFSPRASSWISASLVAGPGSTGARQMGAELGDVAGVVGKGIRRPGSSARTTPGNQIAMRPPSPHLHPRGRGGSAIQYPFPQPRSFLSMSSWSLSFLVGPARRRPPRPMILFPIKNPLAPCLLYRSLCSVFSFLHRILMSCAVPSAHRDGSVYPLGRGLSGLSLAPSLCAATSPQVFAPGAHTRPQGLTANLGGGPSMQQR